MTYSVGSGAEIGIMGNRRNTAREALEAAEEYLGANRPNVVITDLATGQRVTLENLRELAEREADDEAKRP